MMILHHRGTYLCVQMPIEMHMLLHEKCCRFGKLEKIVEKRKLTSQHIGLHEEKSLN